MMPPKKSKAAREVEESPPPSVAPPVEEKINGKAKEESNDGEVDKKVVNVFKVEILDSKRERKVPVQETFLKSWISENFESKEGVRINFADIFDCYVDKCTDNFVNGVEQHVVIKVFKEQFPSGFTVKEVSEYKDELKERKISVKREKVEGETMKLKMRDILEEVLKEAGNPKTGIRFNGLVKLITSKYPALRLDINSNPLRRTLDSGLRYGYVDLIKGVGKCGFYRFYNAEEAAKEEEEEKKAKEEAKKKKKEAKENDDGENKEENGTEGDAEANNEKENEADGKAVKKSAKKRKQKPKKASKPKKRKLSKIVHSNPQNIGETFQLAMTFMSEPKIASTTRIRRYLEDYYDVPNLDTKLKKTLESGIEKGYWALITGSLNTGSFELQMEEFDPTDDNDTYGKIINALMACNEPKQCSSNLLKKYLLEYHPDFQVADKPYLFKRALERAVANDVLRQLSGLGSSGTFQLAQPFIPGPNILSGKDTASDYEVSEPESSDDENVGEQGFKHGFDEAYFQTSNYTPRPSKRRGMARKIAPIQKLAYTPTDPSVRKRKAKSTTTSRGGGKKKVYAESSSEEEDDEDDEDSSAEEEEDEDEYSKNAEKYKPRPSKSRGGGGSSRKAPAPAPAKRKAPAKKKAAPVKNQAAAPAAPAKGKAKSVAPAKGKKVAPKKGAAKGAKKRGRR